MAKSFLTRNKISKMKLLWDGTGISWAKLRIPAQPAWMLIATDGTVIDAELGSIPYAAVIGAL